MRPTQRRLDSANVLSIPWAASACARAEPGSPPAGAPRRRWTLRAFPAGARPVRSRRRRSRRVARMPSRSARGGVGGAHRVDCRHQPLRPRVATHMAGQHDPGPERFGQERRSPGCKPALRRILRIHQAGDRRNPAPLPRPRRCGRRPGRSQRSRRISSRPEHRGQVGPHLGWRGVGYRGDRQAVHGSAPMA